MDKLMEKIELQAKNTVGYQESINKESFMIGVSVAFRCTSEHYCKTIKHLESQLETYKAAHQTVDDDMRLLVRIINKYGD